MPFIDLVRKRQSVRRFKPDPVPRETIDRCLEAARLAPSACNSQPWRFIVVDDPAQRLALADELFKGPYAMNAHAKSAPVLVAVVREKIPFATLVGSWIKGTPYYLLDIGAAVENFLLAAAEEGLGSCWLGWFPEGLLKKRLGVPWDRRIESLISLGYPDEPQRDKIRKPLDQIRSYSGT